MKEKKIEWLLVGCHHITEVAVAYYPNYAHNSSAVKAFRHSLREHAHLIEELTEAGFNMHTLHLSPQQIAILVRHWGLPTCVWEMIKRNPYIAVPKTYGKI